MPKRRTHEIRLNQDGSLDEVVAHAPKLFHLEQMDTNFWWIGLTLSDGKDLRLEFTAKSGLGVFVERDYPSSEGPWHNRKPRSPR